MEQEEIRQKLLSIIDEYGMPDDQYVGKLPKRRKNKDGSWGPTVYLDYVGHATITKWLIQIDPFWTWEPVEWEDGRPKINVIGGTATMWGRLTVLGKTMLGVGTCEVHKGDLDKELIGDFLRNASMRLGLALGVWAKDQWGDDSHDEDPVPKPQPAAKASLGSKASSSPQKAPAEPVVADKAPQGGSEPLITIEQVAELQGMINALPDAKRVPLKYAFKDKFGTPDSVAASDYHAARKLIEEFAAEEDDF